MARTHKAGILRQAGRDSTCVGKLDILEVAHEFVEVWLLDIHVYADVYRSQYLYNVFFHTKWYRIYSINWINCQIIQYMEL